MDHRIISSELDLSTYAVHECLKLTQWISPLVRKSDFERNPEILDPFGQLVSLRFGH